MGGPDRRRRLPTRRAATCCSSERAALRAVELSKRLILNANMRFVGAFDLSQRARLIFVTDISYVRAKGTARSASRLSCGRHSPRPRRANLPRCWPSISSALPRTRPIEPAAREPAWATPNTIALELKTVRLRDFSTAARRRAHFDVRALCAASRFRRRSRARPQPGRGAARRRPAAAVRHRLALGHAGDALPAHRRLSRRAQRRGRPARRQRRSRRAVPGRLAVAALCRAVSRQGAQAGAGRRADRYRRRAIRIVRARRRQPIGAVS